MRRVLVIQFRVAELPLYFARSTGLENLPICMRIRVVDFRILAELFHLFCSVKSGESRTTGFSLEFNWPWYKDSIRRHRIILLLE